MINRIFRLVDVKRIEIAQRELLLKQGMAIVRPQYMSICQADMRYYLGKRSTKIMKQKLPLALIHEAVGSVLLDTSDTFPRGQRVVMIPNVVGDGYDGIKANYRPTSMFRSSSMDGFLQDLLLISPERLIALPEGDGRLFVLAELISVAYNALEAFERHNVTNKKIFGVWGDGSLGFVMCLVLRSAFPDAKISIIGKNWRKLERFSFTDSTYHVDLLPEGLMFNHCFECVGGSGSENAIRQIEKHILPQGCVSLLGVSETPINIDTRLALEKGLILIGNSRSEKTDFQKAVNLIAGDKAAQRYLRFIISQVCEVHTLSELYNAFEQGQINDFKTVISWNT